MEMLSLQPACLPAVVGHFILSIPLLYIIPPCWNFVFTSTLCLWELRVNKHLVSMTFLQGMLGCNSILHLWTPGHTCDICTATAALEVGGLAIAVVQVDACRVIWTLPAQLQLVILAQTGSRSSRPTRQLIPLDNKTPFLHRAWPLSCPRLALIELIPSRNR